MITSLSARIGAQSRSVLGNSAALMANTVSGSACGFLFWLIAARSLSGAQVGTAAAYLSALTLLATTSEMGLGTALIRYTPTLSSRRVEFINSTLMAGTLVAAILSSAFALATPIWSPELATLGTSMLALCIFVVAVVAFSLGQLLDRVFIAFQSARLLFIRNLVANLLRLALLMACVRPLGPAALLVAVGASALATSWIALRWFVPRVVPEYHLRTTLAWSVLVDKAAYTLGNHVALLIWNAPQFIYPLLVVGLLGAEAGAQFYVSWMLANLLLIVPTAISTATFARAAQNSSMDGQALRQGLRATLALLLPGGIALLAGAQLVLPVFGAVYTRAGTGLLVPLVISTLPYAVTTFAIVYYRISKQTARVLGISACATSMCMLLSSGGAMLYGLRGIGFGWLAGQTLAALGLLCIGRRASRRSAPRPRAPLLRNS